MKEVHFSSHHSSHLSFDLMSEKKRKTADKSAAGKKTKTDTKKDEKNDEKKSGLPSSEGFMKSAKPLHMTIGDEDFVLEPKTFSTGSYGWGTAGKTLKVKVSREEMTAQVTVNLIVRGSKEAKGEDPEEEDEE